MNKQTDQLELIQIVAKQTLLDESIVEAFIGQLFTEIEKSIIVDSHIKVDGFGLFRVIKSGDTHRILYLGSNTPIDKSVDLSHINIQSLSDCNNIESVDSEKKIFEQNKFSENNEMDNSTIKTENQTSQDDDEADAIVIRKFLESESKTDTHKNHNHNTTIPTNLRKLNLVRTCIITLIVLTLLGIGYMILLGSSIKPNEKISGVIIFKELENTDTINYSRIIIPESDVSLQYISEIYYGSDVYWSYIFEANKNIVNSQLIIQAGSITKIPKVTVNLADLDN